MYNFKRKSQQSCLSYYWLLWLLLLQQAVTMVSFAITNGHCQKNISVKYQVPVTKVRDSTAATLASPSSPSSRTNELIPPANSEQYLAFEEHVRWDTVQICCPGYRTIFFGFCEPICNETCPPHSYCVEPNKCICMRGYEPSHHPNKQHQLICRPICQGGCPEHSHCIAHNDCICRPGYKDVSSWFSPLRCERIQCGPDQRYDVTRRSCVKIEMSMEELMQRVAERLANGLVKEEDDADADANANADDDNVTATMI